MSERTDIWVVCYDIADPGLRQQISDMLLGYGVRVQQSVFELRLPKSVMYRLWGRLTAQLTFADSLRLYRIPPGAREDTRSFNGTPPPEAGEFWIF